MSSVRCLAIDCELQRLVTVNVLDAAASASAVNRKAYRRQLSVKFIRGRVTSEASVNVFSDKVDNVTQSNDAVRRIQLDLLNED